MKFPILTEQDKKKAIELVKNCDLKKEHFFELKKIYKKRNTDQNALYWAWLNYIYEETGNEQDFMHEWFKQKFCPEKTKEFNGVKITVKSTKLLDKKEMSEYMERIKIFMQEKAEIYLLSKSDPLFHIFYEQYK